MASYRDMTYAVTLKHNDLIRKACAPLFECFNLCHFWYYKLTNEGFISSIGAHAGWSEYFVAEQLYLKYPYVRHPKYISNFIALQKNIQEFPFKEIAADCRSKFQMQQSLQIVIKREDGFEEYGFSSKDGSDAQTALFFNELPLLKLFVRKFKEEHKLLFSKAEDNQADMKKYLGPLFFERPQIPHEIHRQAFFKKIGWGWDLTPAETSVLKLALKGCSASEIGKELFRSKRTIEHHMERLKDKLGCDSKRALIQKRTRIRTVGIFPSDCDMNYSVTY